MKRFVISLCFFYVMAASSSPFRLMAQEMAQPSAVFDMYQEAVVMVSQNLYFDSQYARNPEHIKEVEKVFDTKILDSYVPIATGSAFFITPDGYLLTNNHVIDNTELQIAKKVLYRSMVRAINDSLHKFSFTTRQVDRIEEDFWSMIEKAQFQYQVRLNDKSVYVPEILLKDEKNDMALLQIKPAGNEQIPRTKFVVLADNKNLKVGENVIAIGYPIPGILETLFKDHQPTLTVGYVSALRNENWGIQHTASISPGNSGGPLFNFSGNVVGMNVARITDASSIYFSIPAQRIVDWIMGSAYASLLDK